MKIQFKASLPYEELDTVPQDLSSILQGYPLPCHQPPPHQRPQASQPISEWPVLQAKPPHGCL